jgi:hypothetical protein
LTAARAEDKQQEGKEDRRGNERSNENERREATAICERVDRGVEPLTMMFFLKCRDRADEQKFFKI